MCLATTVVSGTRKSEGRGDTGDTVAFFSFILHLARPFITTYQMEDFLRAPSQGAMSHLPQGSQEAPILKNPDSS